MDGVATLIRYEKIGEDNIGQPIVNTVEKEIFVSARSIGGSEFYNAGRNGLRAELSLVTSEYNYNGENEVVYDGKQYTIYRTYHADDSDEIELYLERRVADVDKGINR